MLKNIISIKRDDLIIRFISFFWIIAKLLISDAWNGNRDFPIIPLVPYFQNPEYLLFANALSILLLLIIILCPKPLFIVLLIFTELFIISCDYIFLQPWEWTYIVFFTVYAVLKHNSIKFRYVVHLFICSIYILSGFHKLNIDFLTNVWHRMILNNFLGFSTTTVLKYKLFFFGLSLPITEIILGLCLLFYSRKIKYSILLILLHIFILIFIGPLGLNYNQIVWPWNICMIGILIFLYSNEIIKVKRFSYLNVTFTIIPVILIILGTTSCFTFNLYSGKNPQFYIYGSQPFPNQYPQKKDKQNWYFNAQEWALHDINLPPNPDKWYMETLKEKLKIKFKDRELKIIE